jgi:hypothetical protein
MHKALFLSPPPWWNGGVLLVTQPSPKAISTPLPSPVLQLIRPGQAIYERSRMLMLLSSPSSASTGLGFSCQRRQRSRTIPWLEDVKMATHACRKQEEGMAKHICTCYQCVCCAWRALGSEHMDELGFGFWGALLFSGRKIHRWVC